MEELAKKRKMKYKRALQLRRRNLEKQTMMNKMNQYKENKEKDLKQKSKPEVNVAPGKEVDENRKEMMRNTFEKRKAMGKVFNKPASKPVLAQKKDMLAKKYGEMSNRPKVKLAQNRAGAQSRLARVDEAKKAEWQKMKNKYA